MNFLDACAMAAETDCLMQRRAWTDDRRLSIAPALLSGEAAVEVFAAAGYYHLLLEDVQADDWERAWVLEEIREQAEKPLGAFVYFMQAGRCGPIKIGHSNNPFRRRQRLQTGSPRTLAMLGYTPGGLAEEQELHRRFAEFRIEREWFEPSPEVLNACREAAAYCDHHGLPRSEWR